MTEKELAKRLLELDANAGESATTEELTRRILARDKKRVKIMAWITGICWVGALLALYWSTYMFMSKHSDILRGTAENVDPVIIDLSRAVLIAQGSIEGVIFALLCTLILFTYSRKATLRQVNASLMEISRAVNSGQSAVDS